MSAFEDFVQVELPKRGYLNVDAPQESVIIRRGAGPRQFDAIQFTEGQVLAYVDGTLQAVPVSSVIKKAVLTVAAAVTTWNLAHNLGSENVIIQCFDDTKKVIIPDTIQIVDENNVQITFGDAQAGVARVIFLD